LVFLALFRFLLFGLLCFSFRSSSLQSPYTVNFIGVSFGNFVSIVMEYCARKSLYHVLQEKNGKRFLGWDRAFKFMLDITAGVAVLHMHDPEILHRDLKSLNVLVSKDWDCKVADFGLSRFNVDSEFGS
jgi:serine/threonine protein kinase